MKKRTKRFDAGGMASSGPQPAFYQPRTPVGTDTGVGGVAAAPLPGPLNLGQQQQQPQQPMQMKKGGKVQKFCRGGGVEVRGKTRGKFV